MFLILKVFLAQEDNRGNLLTTTGNFTFSFSRPEENQTTVSKLFLQSAPSWVALSLFTLPLTPKTESPVEQLDGDRATKPGNDTTNFTAEQLSHSRCFVASQQN